MKEKDAFTLRRGDRVGLLYHGSLLFGKVIKIDESYGWDINSKHIRKRWITVQVDLGAQNYLWKTPLHREDAAPGRQSAICFSGIYSNRERAIIHPNGVALVAAPKPTCTCAET